MFLQTPNCEFGEAGEGLIALTHINRGEILTVGIDDGDEYEEYEYDPISGKMAKVAASD